MGKADVDEERTARGLPWAVFFKSHRNRQKAVSLSPKIERALRKSRAVHSSTPELKRGRKLASVCRTSTPFRDRAGADVLTKCIGWMQSRAISPDEHRVSLPDSFPRQIHQRG